MRAAPWRSSEPVLAVIRWREDDIAIAIRWQWDLAHATGRRAQWMQITDVLHGMRLLLAAGEAVGERGGRSLEARQQRQALIDAVDLLDEIAIHHAANACKPTAPIGGSHLGQAKPY